MVIYFDITFPVSSHRTLKHVPVFNQDTPCLKCRLVSGWHELQVCGTTYRSQQCGPLVPFFSKLWSRLSVLYVLAQLKGSVGIREQCSSSYNSVGRSSVEFGPSWCISCVTWGQVRQGKFQIPLSAMRLVLDLCDSAWLEAAHAGLLWARGLIARSVSEFVFDGIE